MKGELHLPDLPEVPVALGPPGGLSAPEEPRTRPGGLARLRESFTGYLPLLLMILLALGTWLVAKNSPGLLMPSVSTPLKHEADYTLDHFTLQRFDPGGALKVQIDGEHMQHFPDDDTMEVEKIHVVSTDAQGHRMTATALHGRAKGDATEVWLDGEARVVNEADGQQPVQLTGEHLRAEPKMKRVDSDWPVVVQEGDSEFHAQGLFYDGDTRILTLRGTAHATLQPSLRAATAAPKKKKS